MRIAYDIVKMQPGCVLIQAQMGGLDNLTLSDYFPTETWLLAPTPDMQVREVTTTQLRILSEATKWRMKPTHPTPSPQGIPPKE
jgi:hypothetical protein